MHRLDARSQHRIIDHDRACDAVAAIGDRADVARWAGLFAMLGEPGRLAILLAIHHVGPISVSDLAVAVEMNDAAVSQALRVLRHQQAVVAERDGRVIRYRLADPVVGELLARVRPEPRLQHHSVAHAH
ncbi:metalloregulator ArsR/SmtB family transcription factor [Frankia sp. KB5]|uniref:ArsR/SmtB family transcription factor n=1 Tax=Frankia sp. KB5 TaxID=683318 RepID=UPI000A0F4051|nr:metalloregulator ArsR/SmtB family transcription factor [Frankia sp. KB5]ORT53514.1 MarR family transcriptional regulator [Frankia sp. KB5]